MLRVNRVFLLFTFLSASAFAQYNAALQFSKKSYSNSSFTQYSKSLLSEPSPEAELLFKPSVGLGIGMFSFYGDIYSKKFQSPSVSRIAYELYVEQPLNKFLRVDFYALRGRLGANENYNVNNRNVNFDSRITAGGVNLIYDFGNFLKPDRDGSPYISLGVEAIEFLSKTDMYDKFGNKYYYWTDGSIRNMPSNSPDAANAATIQRDYSYETDIRELNQDGFGKYSEHSWAIPVGVGYILNLNEYLTFRMGATMHYTFTDYIDGITKNGIGDRQGNSKNDKFMMSSFSISYNFGVNKKEDSEKELQLSDAEMLAIDADDEDKDGVLDLKDECPGTPTGVGVDVKGCPVDDDLDGVPNYKDNELNSAIGAYVDDKGVTMSDSLIALKYNQYIDSTGGFLPVEAFEHNGRYVKSNAPQKIYTVSIGAYSKGLAPEMMTKLLSIKDINSTIVNDSTTEYNAGSFTDLLQAEKRKRELVEMGMSNAKVVYKENGVYKDAPTFVSNVQPKSNEAKDIKTEVPPAKNDKGEKQNQTSENEKTENKVAGKTENKNNKTENKNSATTDGSVVLRVQLGAYNKRLSKRVFADINDLIEIKTEEGLYKYMTGSFNSFDEAAKRKVEMIMKGYEGAFITAYKNGKRITTQEAGATLSNKQETESTNAEQENKSAVDKKLVEFRVQLGVFTSELPDDKRALYSKLNGVEQVGTKSGSVRYIVGHFSDYAQAQEYKKVVMNEYGINDAFLVAFFNNQIISVQEALELLK
jgi:hypothetical protein